MLLSHHYDTMQQVHGMIAIFTVPVVKTQLPYVACETVWADM